MKSENKYMKKQLVYVCGLCLTAVLAGAGCGRKTDEPQISEQVTEAEEPVEIPERAEVAETAEITETAEVIESVESVETEAEEQPPVYDYSEFFEHMDAQMKELEQQQAQTQTKNGYDRAKAEEAFAKINEQRITAGLGALAWDESLYETACGRAQDIITDFSHDGCPAELGENIAENFKSVTNLVSAWMDSSGHRENILDERYTAGAMACFCQDGAYYWVNLFRF